MLTEQEWNALATILGVNPSDRSRLKALSAVPLMWELDEGFVLDSRGNVARYYSNGSLLPCTDLRTANIAVMSAARFAPALAKFVKRPDKVEPCPECQGSGVHPYESQVPGGVLGCYCGGLGWIPA